ncbi:pyridoxamine 5'-phosphate oxidase family protein [Sinomonas sp. ASV322]|uniref:pyridoxine/pyridoxamine 5'-phosphate oxidase n=1 Tax=Sinomonas sp. ASV322 TaxID=3041920 RepID=UPI0027DE938A|nr:pyridoxamine 5'-phosphate oxidase family protein [Sinomonas sp. ASV322]MDQ4503446.1 pyridoxamine 5'-phosphate oxidase family protein [Sinomonas sp. ASV322]
MIPFDAGAPGSLAAAGEADDGAPADPFALLAAWLPGWDGAPLGPMTLATIGRDGYPAARTVLLSGFDGERFFFHTDARSAKAAELATNPRAAATLVWPEAGRQLVVTGDVERLTASDAAAAYSHRTRYLQVLAWANDAEMAQHSLAERRERWRAFDAAHPPGMLAPPPHWAGYALAPVRISFWLADDAGPSHRLAYERDGGRWALAALPG